jgi:uncharacterized protein (DUF433 family)
VTGEDILKGWPELEREDIMQALGCGRLAMAAVWQ